MKEDIILLNQNFKELNPLLCGFEECSKGYGFGPASREYYLLHYVVRGKGSFTIKDRVYNLKKGNIFVIRPNEITYYEADKNDPWKYIWIGFQCSYESNVLRQATFLNEDILYSQAAEYIFKEMLDASKINQTKELFLTSKLYELFSLLIEEKKNIAEQDFPEIYVMKAESFILANYMNDITVEGISKFLGINRVYFSGIFKRAKGKSPKQYIVDVRLEKAAKLILSSNLTPSEVAKSTGYKDIFNFSKMFKKKFGVAPLYYKDFVTHNQ